MGDGSDKVKKEIIAQHLSEIPSKINFQKELSDKYPAYEGVYAYTPSVEGENFNHTNSPIMDKRMQIIISDIEDWPPALTIKVDNHVSGSRITIIALSIISILFIIVLVMAICFYIILFKK
jgi:hypothetical protein